VVSTAYNELQRKGRSSNSKGHPDFNLLTRREEVTLITVYLFSLRKAKQGELRRTESSMLLPLLTQRFG
jgi:hypothetical protein